MRKKLGKYGRAVEKLRSNSNPKVILRAFSKNVRFKPQMARNSQWAIPLTRAISSIKLNIEPLSRMNKRMGKAMRLVNQRFKCIGFYL
jgi:hypothetical protein